jgi:hypothetical protein
VRATSSRGRMADPAHHGAVAGTTSEMAAVMGEMTVADRQRVIDFMDGPPWSERPGRIKDERSAANEPGLIAGVATAWLEIFEQKPDPDAIVVPVGGDSGAVAARLVATALSPLSVRGAVWAPAVKEGLQVLGSRFLDLRKAGWCALSRTPGGRPSGRRPGMRSACPGWSGSAGWGPRRSAPPSAGRTTGTTSGSG